MENFAAHATQILLLAFLTITFLQSGIDKVATDDSLAENTVPLHQNVRGPEYYQPSAGGQ